MKKPRGRGRLIHDFEGITAMAEGIEKMEDSSEKSVLYVKTFGGFSMTWKEKLLTGSIKSSESQFIYLMQLLLHHRENGIERDTVEEILFEDRDIANIHHSMQSVVYNAKKRLRQMGLPETNYIELKRGVFHWTKKIPVVEDAEEFENLCQKAESEGDDEKRLELYLKACHAYRGEFLPLQAGIIWAAQEARRYSEMFCHCVESAVLLLRGNEDYIRMEELGVYASKIQPLSDWETVTMEALISQNRYEEAQRLYDETVDFYSQKQGLRPSKSFMELFSRLGAQLHHQYATLDEIQKGLSGLEDEPAVTGGYLCPYPVFEGIYRIVERMMERGGQSVYLMLCTVVDSKGNPMKDGPMLDELSRRLEDAIVKSVRHSDTINRYGKGQYLVLLINTTRENCVLIQKRINDQFIIGRQRTGVQYYVSSVICPPMKP